MSVIFCITTLAASAIQQMHTCAHKVKSMQQLLAAESALCELEQKVGS